MIAEGYNASRCIHTINQTKKIALPLADILYEILWNHANAKEAFKSIERLLI
jgi:glycerol-3-phosphate dehydrogenase (NAD(P)+)